MKVKPNIKIKTKIKAGATVIDRSSDRNHNQTLAHEERKNLRVKTRVKSGSKGGFIVIERSGNHNQTLAHEAKKTLRIKTNIKAGLPAIQ